MLSILGPLGTVLPSINAQSLDPQITAKRFTLKEKQSLYCQSREVPGSDHQLQEQSRRDPPKRWGRDVIKVAKEKGEGNSKLGIATNLKLTQILTRITYSAALCLGGIATLLSHKDTWCCILISDWPLPVG